MLSQERGPVRLVDLFWFGRRDEKKSFGHWSGLADSTIMFFYADDFMRSIERGRNDSGADTDFVSSGGSPPLKYRNKYYVGGYRTPVSPALCLLFLGGCVTVALVNLYVGLSLLAVGLLAWFGVTVWYNRHEDRLSIYAVFAVPKLEHKYDSDVREDAYAFNSRGPMWLSESDEPLNIPENTITNEDIPNPEKFHFYLLDGEFFRTQFGPDELPQ